MPRRPHRSSSAPSDLLSHRASADEVSKVSAQEKEAKVNLLAAVAASSGASSTTWSSASTSPPSSLFSLPSAASAKSSLPSGFGHPFTRSHDSVIQRSRFQDSRSSSPSQFERSLSKSGGLKGSASAASLGSVSSQQTRRSVGDNLGRPVRGGHSWPVPASMLRLDIQNRRSTSGEDTEISERIEHFTFDKDLFTEMHADTKNADEKEGDDEYYHSRVVVAVRSDCDYG